jgi:hypothetical protein
MAAKTRKIILSLLIMFILINTAIAAVKTFQVQETDLVKIEPHAIDPDNDHVVYYYSPPLDDNGEWQTGYEDAGEYNLEIKASDGMNESIKKVKVIVENKNRPPQLTENKIFIKETQKFDLKEIISDPDNDALSYSFKEPFDSNGVWQPGYEDSGLYIAEMIISDGEFNVPARVEIEVVNTNSPPTLVNSFSEKKIITVKENELFEFNVQATDLDNDDLTYVWELDQELISTEENGEYLFNYEGEGEHSLVLIISDEINEADYEWTINVENINRAPNFMVDPLTVYEGDKLFLDLPDVDEDGDLLSFTFETPLDENGEWQVGYEDAGEYNLKVTATDGEFTVIEEVEITIVDVDRAPVLGLPEKIEAWEGAPLNIEINTYDEDGDEINLVIETLPEDALLNNKTLSWTPSYDTIKRSGGFISNILNYLRLERFLLVKKEFPVTVTSCGKDLCSTSLIDLVVYNTNRMPVMNNIDDFSVFATDFINLDPVAVDPDGDILRYRFTNPLSKYNGKWKTSYSDPGTYATFVTATDGKLSTTVPVIIEVLKNNRMPTLNINDDKVVVNEGQQFLLKFRTTDPDNDELELVLENAPEGSSFADGMFLWTPPHNAVINKTEGWWNNFVSGYSYLNKKFGKDKSHIVLEFKVTDGEYEVVHPVEVIVKNVNQAPKIIDYLPAEQELDVMVGKTITFHALVEDLDQEKMDYKWTFGMFEGSVTGTDTITRTFTSPGRKKIKVLVSDGRDETEMEWYVKAVFEDVDEEEIIVIEEVEEERPFTVGVYVIEN